MIKRSIAVVFLVIGVSISAISILPSHSKASIHYVGGGGSSNYTTIQEAIDNATNGDTIYVYSGTYVEAILVHKPISLVGEDRLTTVIDPEESGIPANVSSDWVNITGFTFRSNWSNEPGIVASGVSNCNISDITVTNHEYGIFLSDSNGNTISGNSFFNNTAGVHLFRSDKNALVGNNISSNIFYGMVIGESGNNSLEDNLVSLNGRGIIGGGILLGSSMFNTFVRNAISLSSNFGVMLDHSDNNVFLDNVISSVNGTGMRLESSSGNQVYHNQFRDNSAQAFDDTGFNEWDAGFPVGGNYWSDFVGVDEMTGVNQDEPGFDGIGDTTYSIPGVGNEDHYPLLWLGNQHPVCEIVYPAEHERIHETYAITGTADDEDGDIEKVEIRIEEGPWIDVEGNTSWSYEWHTEDIENGEYTIYARSYDGTNYSLEVNVTVDVHNPTAEEKMLGEIFFWVLLVLVVVIAVAGIALEIRRRKKA